MERPITLQVTTVKCRANFFFTERQVVQRMYRRPQRVNCFRSIDKSIQLLIHLIIQEITYSDTLEATLFCPTIFIKNHVL